MLHWGTRLGWAAAARPRAALAILVTTVLVMVPGLLRLEIWTGGHTKPIARAARGPPGSVRCPFENRGFETGFPTSGDQEP